MLTVLAKGIIRALGLISSFGIASCNSPDGSVGARSDATAGAVRTDTAQAVGSNGRVLVAGTQTGVILVSTDSGASWTRKELGHVSVVAIDACPNGKFVAADFYHGVWMGSSDGSTWSKSAFRGDWNPLAVACDADSHLWVVGTNASIATSADQGATWRYSNLNQDLHLTAIRFPTRNFGIVVGEFGTVAISRDVGVTWTRQAPISGDFYPYDVLFTDDMTGYVTGVAGQTLRSIDGAKTWQTVENTTGVSLYRLFRHDGQPWAVGAVGTIASITNSRWESARYDAAAPAFLGAGVSISKREILVGGPGGLLRVITPQFRPSLTSIGIPAWSSSPQKMAEVGNSGFRE